MKAQNKTEPFVRVRCPHCDSTQHKCISSRKRDNFRIRYHDCHKCKEPFRSMEDLTNA